MATIILWIISIPLIILGVNKYIEEKDNRLRKEYFEAIQNIFHDGEYIDVIYSGRNVSYKRIDIPNKPSKKDFPNYPELYGTALKRWKNKYGDLSSFYQIDNKRNKLSGSSEAEDGWELLKINWSFDESTEPTNLIIEMSCIFPYAVGFNNYNRDLLYGFAPSVQNAVDEAFKFFTSDPNSDLNYKKGSYNKFFSNIQEIDNEYYYIQRDTVRKGGTLIGESPIRGELVNGDNNKNSPIQWDGVQNGVYKVFVGITQPITWSMQRSDSSIKEDRTKLLMCWIIPVCILFGIIVILQTIKLRRNNRRMNETDYHKLQRLSHPRNFMKPYDKDKVEKANSIYKEVEQIKEDDVEKINSLIQRCIDDLGISFIDSVSLEELKQRINPENFMNPYDAEKVQLANDLFAILSKSDLTYVEYVEVKKKAVKL